MSKNPLVETEEKKLFQLSLRIMVEKNLINFEEFLAWISQQKLFKHLFFRFRLDVRPFFAHFPSGMQISAEAKQMKETV